MKYPPTLVGGFYAALRLRANVAQQAQQLGAQLDQPPALAGFVIALAALAAWVRAGLNAANFAQRRQLVALLIDHPRFRQFAMGLVRSPQCPRTNCSHAAGPAAAGYLIADTFRRLAPPFVGGPHGLLVHLR